MSLFTISWSEGISKFFCTNTIDLTLNLHYLNELQLNVIKYLQ